MTHRTDGDLTDVGVWERAWGRSPKRRLPHNEHRLLFRSLLAYAGGATRPLDVLEIGCAPGDMLLNMASEAPTHRYSGVDYAARALADTVARFETLGAKADFHCHDVRMFTPPHEYDLVVSFGLIEHFDDPSEIVAHHVRLARPGGVVGVMVPNYSHRALRRALAYYSPDTLRTHNLDMMRTDHMRMLLERAGLVDVETGSYGGAIIPVANAIGGLPGRMVRGVASAWNRTVRVLPRNWSPWQVFLWARGRKP